MSTHQVRSYTLSGAAMDVFTKLYHKGPQEDGDLPSKAGMTELIDIGLAKKDTRQDGINKLTKLGEHEAGVSFTQVAVNKQQEEAAAREAEEEDTTDEAEQA